MSSTKKRRELLRAQTEADTASFRLGTDKAVAAMWKVGAEELQKRLDAATAENATLKAELEKFGTMKSQKAWAIENADLRIELSGLRSSEPVAYRMFDDFSAGDWEYNTVDKFSHGRAGGEPLFTHKQPTQSDAKDAWQPIDTAPKDGSYGVGFNPEYANKLWLLRFTETLILTGFTHWMPLPPMPNIDAAMKEQS